MTSQNPFKSKLFYDYFIPFPFSEDKAEDNCLFLQQTVCAASWAQTYDLSLGILLQISVKVPEQLSESMYLYANS